MKSAVGVFGTTYMGLDRCGLHAPTAKLGGVGADLSALGEREATATGFRQWKREGEVIRVYFGTIRRARSNSWLFNRMPD